MALGARGTNCLRPANFLYNSKMNFNSKKISLIILGITSLICSRVMFLFLNDPGGPNLLVVMGLAVIVYLLSLSVYYIPIFTEYKRLQLVFLIQIILVAGFSVFLK